MLKRVCIFFVCSIIISCGSSIIKIDPYLKDNTTQFDKKDCKDKCKGLKGKQRADCNKNCNQQNQK